MPTAAEALVDVPKMQRDLQRARAENVRFREFLRQMSMSAADVALVASGPDAQHPSDGDESDGPGSASKAAAAAPQQQEDDDDAEDDGDNAYGRRARAAPEASKALELKHAEERVAQLEARLLDAEETICHLQAERKAALRDAERSRLALAERVSGCGGSDGDDGDGQADLEMRALVLELESRLSDARRDHATGQEQQMAVIREQESEIRALARDVAARDQELASLRAAYLRAVEEVQLASDTDAVRVADVKVGGDEEQAATAAGVEEEKGEEEEKEEKVEDTERGADGAAAWGGDLAWHEEWVRHPTPHFDLDSPEVQYLLHTWTGNVKKLQYLRLWFARVATTRGALPEDFPLGIELPRLTPEVRDGFLALVVPLLRRQTEREILVHSRRYNDPLHSDLRIRVVPRR